MTAPASHSLAIVAPVFNDWVSLALLIRELDDLARSIAYKVTLVVVNDGSTLPAPPDSDFLARHLVAVEIISLNCNLGHQRAIAIGLSECIRSGRFSSILVMDSDGEDSPSDVSKLLQAHKNSPDKIIVASRSKRSEGPLFRVAYACYKSAFRLLTGKTIDFGNFCLFPVEAARRLAHSPDCWNHLAAAVVKSRVGIVGIATERGQRYAGRSTMNVVSLVVHGFSAISVFSDTVLTRLLLVFGLTSLVAISSGIAAIVLRLFTDLAIPGWATNVFGLSALLFVQSLTLLATMIFTNLSGRSSIPFIPAMQSTIFIARTVAVHVKTHGNV